MNGHEQVASDYILLGQCCLSGETTACISVGLSAEYALTLLMLLLLLHACVWPSEQEGVTVLDIGTGTGILAVMAAKAGAKHVYACEVNGVLCDIAREVLERCGTSPHAQWLRAGVSKGVFQLRLLGNIQCFQSPRNGIH